MPIRFAGRAATRFDDAVEHRTSSPSSTTSSSAAVDHELLDLVAAMRAMPVVEPSPAYAVGLRERLMDEADRLAAERASAMGTADGAAEDRLRLPVRTPRRRLTLAAGTLAALGVGASVGVAAQSALPGEPLYGVKRALEAAQTRVAVDDVSRAELLMDRASDRLGEADALLAEGADDPATAARLSSTLDAFGDQAGEAAALLLAEYDRTGDRALVTDLRTFTAASGASLTDLDPVPDDARPAWDRAVGVVAAIDTDALAACPLCSADLAAFTAPTTPATPDFDEASERPAAGQTPDGAPGDGDPGRGGDGSGGSGGSGGEAGPGSDPGDSVPTDPPSAPGVPGSPGGAGGLDDVTGALPGVDGMTSGVTGGVVDGLRGLRDALPGGGSGSGGSGGGGGNGSGGGGGNGGGNGGGGNGGGGNGGGKTGDLVDGLDGLLP